MSDHPSEQQLPSLPPDPRDGDRPLGVLEVERDGQRLALPLASVEYRATVSERVADVTLTEVFENPYAEHLEAVYIFPLSGGSAVRSFTLEVAGRTIRGVDKERAEARAEYQRAIEAGKRAALLEQERENVFTVKVGNLPPGERATVRVSYAERLELFDDSRAELRLPLVVAPRYTPGTPLDRENSGDGVEDDTDEVPDASRVTPPRLAPGASAGPDVRVEVTLVGDAAAFADLASSQHATATSFAGGGLTVRLAKTTERANRDFVLRWRLAGERVRSSLAVFRHPERGLFGMLTVAAPPAERRPEPRDVVFLLDRSGSMGGIKMQSAARVSRSKTRSSRSRSPIRS
jgi:Ca-activated chloride channel family protein